eukprot:gnl/Chilomastix_caulleri/1384.p1 GENE.gnl/Chilomastix_caulleri/1384~~gnl/Chilomastix_caulleri/1384.p1  ORF type:complete len:131 (+),score=15.11 gnl/Chilomastix_caulleri/1384:66-458(+)
MATPYQRAGLRWVEHAKTLNYLVPPSESQKKLISVDELKNTTGKTMHGVLITVKYTISQRTYHTIQVDLLPFNHIWGKDISRPATSIHPRVKIDELLVKLCVGVLNCSEEVGEGNFPIPEDTPGEKGINI